MDYDCCEHCPIDCWASDIGHTQPCGECEDTARSATPAAYQPKVIGGSSSSTATDARDGPPGELELPFLKLASDGGGRRALPRAISRRTRHVHAQLLA